MFFDKYRAQLKRNQAINRHLMRYRRNKRNYRNSYIVNAFCFSTFFMAMLVVFSYTPIPGHINFELGKGVFIPIFIIMRQFAGELRVNPFIRFPCGLLMCACWVLLTETYWAAHGDGLVTSTELPLYLIIVAVSAWLSKMIVQFGFQEPKKQWS